jgi:hypothetical protein
MQADYGFDISSQGVSKTMLIRPVRNPDRVSSFVTLCVMLCILVFISALFSDYGVTAAMLLLAAFLVAVSAAFDLHGSSTTLVLEPDKLLMRGKTYDRADVASISVIGPVDYRQRAWAVGPAAIAVGVRRATARTDHAVTFDYGARRVVVVHELSEPQAEAVARVLVEWSLMESAIIETQTAIPL